MPFSNQPSLEREHGYAHGGIAGALTQVRYVTVARQALAQLSPEERVGLVAALRQQARAKEIDYPGLHEITGIDSPQALAGLFGHMRMNEPGLFEQLLAGTEFYDRVLSSMDELARREPH